jgi:predicted GIY-YIG superfamily endonuclease
MTTRSNIAGLGATTRRATLASLSDGSGILSIRRFFGGLDGTVHLRHTVRDAVRLNGYGSASTGTEQALPRLRYCVYRAYDDAGQLLYVGFSERYRHRLAEHERKSQWWPEAREVRLLFFVDREAALLDEAVAIRQERPIYNERGLF